MTWGTSSTTLATTRTTPGVSQRVNGSDQFFHSDWLGSTRDLTDITGNTVLAWQHYDAFGQRTWQAGPDFPSEFLFAGDWGYQNEYNSPTEPGVGLQYLQNRYYDPAVGRFISPDPIAFGGGLNLYGYADNDPVNEVDPEGLAAGGVPQLPDFETAPDDQLGGRGETFTARPFLRKGSQVAGIIRIAIEVGGSLNPVTNLGLAANDIKDRKYCSAALRLLGPISGVLGKVPGLSAIRNRGIGIVLGKRRFLPDIAEYTGGRFYTLWPGFNRRLHSGMGFEPFFRLWATRAKTIDVDLRGVDATLVNGRRLSYAEALRRERITEWEVQQILANRAWYRKARFWNIPRNAR